MPLLRDERRTSACIRLAREDSRFVVWVLSPAEVVSALCRLRRAGELDDDLFARAKARLAGYAARWTEMDEIRPVLDLATRLLSHHPLRAADALQLGAALQAAELKPKRLPFVSLDRDLCEAARREGFKVIVPGG